MKSHLGSSYCSDQLPASSVDDDPKLQSAAKFAIVKFQNWTIDCNGSHHMMLKFGNSTLRRTVPSNSFEDSSMYVCEFFSFKHPQMFWYVRALVRFSLKLILLGWVKSKEISSLWFFFKIREWRSTLNWRQKRWRNRHWAFSSTFRSLPAQIYENT